MIEAQKGVTWRALRNAEFLTTEVEWHRSNVVTSFDVRNGTMPVDCITVSDRAAASGKAQTRTRRRLTHRTKAPERGPERGV